MRLTIGGDDLVLHPVQSTQTINVDFDTAIRSVSPMWEIRQLDCWEAIDGWIC